MQVDCKFFYEDLQTYRKELFEEALKCAKSGKVLYIMYNELEELPQLSQELSCEKRHYMKMISFLYATSLESLIGILSTLPDWQQVPSAIILDDISSYINKNNLQTACSLVAMLKDCMRSCCDTLQKSCTLCVSATKEDLSEDYCNLLKELYFDCDYREYSEPIKLPQ